MSNLGIEHHAGDGRTSSTRKSRIDDSIVLWSSLSQVSELQTSESNVHMYQFRVRLSHFSAVVTLEGDK